MLSHCLSERPAEDHKTPVMTGGFWAEIQTGHPLNICLQHYCCHGSWFLGCDNLQFGRYMYQQPRGTCCHRLCCVDVVLTRMWSVHKRHGDMGGGNEVQQHVPVKCGF